jgi:transcription termination factor NusB
MSGRRDNRVAAMQFLYQWSINKTDDLPAALHMFFQEMEEENFISGPSTRRMTSPLPCICFSRKWKRRMESSGITTHSRRI